jgi:hypothetical protein
MRPVTLVTGAITDMEAVEMLLILYFLVVSDVRTLPISLAISLVVFTGICKMPKNALHIGVTAFK